MLIGSDNSDYLCTWKGKVRSENVIKNFDPALFSSKNFLFKLEL